MCWEAVADWQKVATQWRNAAVGGRLRTAVVAEQLTFANGVSETFAECAECAALRNLLPYMRAIARRNDGGEHIEAPLKKLFMDPLVANVWMIEYLDGQRYYVREQPVAGGDQGPFQYLINVTGKTRPGVLRQSSVKQIARAPQAAVAEQVQRILSALDDSNWEESFCQMISVLYAERTMDPILKINLLQQVLETGTRGSYCLEKAFAGHLAWIKEAGVNPFANWVDPTDLPGERNRKAAAEKLDSFPEVEGPCKAAAEELAAFRRQRLAEFRWVGWLFRTREGPWDCAMVNTADATGPLLVAYRPSTGGKPLLATVGRLDRKKAIIDAGVGPLLVEGRPVYLKVP